MLVERRAVELPQAVAVAGEMGRHPVQHHADAVLVAEVDEVHEILRRAVAAGGRVVAHRLVAPTGRERMLADRQQLDVRVAHLLAVLDQLMGQLAVAQPAAGIVAGPPPTAQVDLVERQRLLQPVGLAALAHPLGVVPVVAVQVDHLRGGPRRHFGAEAERVGLLESEF